MNEKKNKKDELYSSKRWHGQLNDLHVTKKGNPTEKQKNRMNKFKKEISDLSNKSKEKGKF